MARKAKPATARPASSSRPRRKTIPLDRQACRQAAASLVCKSFGRVFERLNAERREQERHLAQTWRVALQEATQEYQQETGDAPPASVEEIMIAARLAGWTAAEATAGDYTLADVHRMAVAQKLLMERQNAQATKTGPLPRRPKGTAKTSGRGGHNKKPILAWIVQISEAVASREGIESTAAFQRIERLGDTALAGLIEDELGEPCTAKAIQRWRKRKTTSGSSPHSSVADVPPPADHDHDHDHDRDKNAQRQDAQTVLRTCTRIDGLTFQAEEPSQKTRRRHLREQADAILERAGCPIPLN